MLGCFATDAFAVGRRVALIIGNSAYQNVPTLKNPANDADSLAAMFTSMGFEVVLAHDLTATAMRRTLQDFEDLVAGSDVAVVYFAGHGIEVRGTNYLIPVDAVLRRDVHVADEAVSLDRVLDSLTGAHTLRLVLLDACRNNPFRPSTEGRALNRGLAAVEPEDQTLVSFAAAAGQTAADGNRDHSPYAQALLENLNTQGWELDRVLREINADVRQITGGEQRPVYYGSLPPEPIYLLPPVEEEPAVADVTPPPAAPVNTPSTSPVVVAYDYARMMDTILAYRAFISAYDDPFFETLATDRIAELEAAENAVPATRDPNPAPPDPVAVADVPAAVIATPAPAAQAPEPVVEPQPDLLANASLDRLYWESVKDSIIRSDIEGYLRYFPKGDNKDDALLILASFGRPGSDASRGVLGNTEVSRRLAQLNQANCISIDVLQHALVTTGYLKGAITGTLDEKTRDALMKYQRSLEAESSGLLTPTQTVNLLFAAAVKDDPYSQTAIGVMLARGVVYDQNLLLARAWLERGAAQNLPYAMANLALLYRDGLGVDIDIARARELLQKAVDLGFADARQALSELPTNG